MLNSLKSHNFDSVTIKGTVDFSGPVTLTANRQLTLGTSGVIYADKAVNLDAPYVALGMRFNLPCLHKPRCRHLQWLGSRFTCRRLLGQAC